MAAVPLPRPEEVDRGRARVATEEVSRVAEL